MSDELMPVTCIDCNKAINVSKSTYRHALKKNPTNPPFRCNECLKKYQSELARKRYEQLTPQEKESKKKFLSSISQKRWDDLSEDERTRQIEEFKEAGKKYRDLLTEKDLDGQMERLQKGHQKWWEGLTKEGKNDWIHKIQLGSVDIDRKAVGEKLSNIWKNKSAEELEAYSKSRKEFWNNKSQEEKDLYSIRGKSQWENMSDEERKHMSELMKQGWQSLSNDEREKFKSQHKEYWRTKTDDEMAQWSKMQYDKWVNTPEYKKIEIQNKIRNALLSYWENVPEEVHQKYRENALKNDILRKWKDSLTEEELKCFYKKALLAAQGKNKLGKRFEEYFTKKLHGYELYATNEVSSNNEIEHSWDYAILYYSDQVACFIDLDGAYYHADDSYDYDGIHGKYEYDLRRGKSIPNGVKHCIIRELHFDEDWDWMAHILPLSYDEFIEEEMRYIMSQPFPCPSYTDSALMKSWDKLVCMDPNNKYFSPNFKCHLGDHIIYHFCHSLYDEKVWNEEWVRNALKSHIIYHPHMNRNKLLMCVPHEEFTPPGQARIMLKDQQGEYVDPNCDVGMMLGCIASKIPYRTRCTNIARYNEISNILEFLSKYQIQYDVKIEYNERRNNE